MEIQTDTNPETEAVIHGTPGDYARMRGLLLAAIPLLFFAGLAGLCLGWLLHAWIHSPAWLLGGTAFLGLGTLFYLVRMPAILRAYMKGARGEEAIAAELNRLPAGWHVFHGAMLGRRTEADHIAIGPQGVFLIETKFWSGSIRLEHGSIRVNDAVSSRSPMLQIRSLVIALADRFERETGTRAAVFPVLCFVGSNFEQRCVRSDEVTVCNQRHLLDVLTEGPARLSEDEIAHLAMSLS